MKEESIAKLIKAASEFQGASNNSRKETEGIYKINEPSDLFTIRASLDGEISLISKHFHKKIENPTEKISYKLDLTCSFIRTHFVINDLLLTGDIIEAATLIRKQLEVLTRLIEIDANPLAKLLKKTPNVCNVLNKMGKSLYPELSEIAHSGTPRVGKLIVQNEKGTDKIGPSIYPVFSPMLYDFYKTHCFVSIVWIYWTIGSLKEVYSTEYNSEFDEEIIDEIFFCALANGIIIETVDTETKQ